jgi:hypothetical protein
MLKPDAEGADHPHSIRELFNQGGIDPIRRSA